jgi:tetratricopeptide (TPR) repeat protein
MRSNGKAQLLRHRPWIPIALWATVLALAIGTGAWTRSYLSERRGRAGEETARRVNALIREARTADGEGDLQRAVALLDQALELVRQIDGARGHPPHAVLLVEEASLKVRLRPDDVQARREARQLLDEAGQVEGLPLDLQARIAQDQGALAVLDGDLGRAKEWYSRALSADPADSRSKEHLETLRRTGPEEGQDDR